MAEMQLCSTLLQNRTRVNILMTAVFYMREIEMEAVIFTATHPL